MAELLPIHEAQEKILSVFNTKKPEQCLVEKAYNRTLAEDVFSSVNLPAFANSSMDGFAVYSSDLEIASPVSPVSLPVSLDVPAGFSEKAALRKGAAARILTGAPLPEGADAVIPVEDTDQIKQPQNGPLPQVVTFYAAIKQGANIRTVGEDVAAGELVLKKGRILQPQDIGLLISLGIREVKVMKKARIALFSSGDELLNPDETMSPGKIYDANRYVLTGMLEAAGAEVIQLGIARDDPKNVMDTLDQTLQEPPDLIIGSAGVSVGAFDYVRQVIEANGSLSFWRVNMRPGKPVAFGFYKSIPFIGLPGNPVSAYISTLVFVLPCVRKLHGLPPYSQKKVKVVLDEHLESADGRESFYRGIVRFENGGYRARLTGHQGSGNLFSLIQANALLIVPAGVKVVPEGEMVDAWLLEAGID